MLSHCISVTLYICHITYYHITYLSHYIYRITCHITHLSHYMLSQCICSMTYCQMKYVTLHVVTLHICHITYLSHCICHITCCHITRCHITESKFQNQAVLPLNKRDISAAMHTNRCNRIGVEPTSLN
jgi:hypothetical protein